MSLKNKEYNKPLDLRYKISPIIALCEGETCNDWGIPNDCTPTDCAPADCTPADCVTDCTSDCNEWGI